MALVDIMNGKGVQHVPAVVYEAMFMFVYKMTLEKVRELSQRDFYAHVPIVDVLFRHMTQKINL